MSSADHTLPRFDLPAFTEEPVSPALVGGRYRLLSKTGAGSSAVVYRALDLQTDQDVAVKLFHDGVAGRDFLRREREFRVLAELRHPGLVEFRESGFDLDRAYLVMRLVEGPTVAGRILCGTLTATETARLGAAVAEALAYVHSRGVTHRDLKPANILLADDRPLLTDFGLAHRLGSSDLTASGAVVGTAAYMAPEQVRGRDVGPPADVYALGLILLECLTGYREYPGTMVESALARLTRSPEIPDSVPPALAGLLSRMTDPDPAARPTAAQLATELATAAQLAAGLATAVQPATETPTAVFSQVDLPAAEHEPEPAVRRPRKRRRRMVLSAALPAAAAALAGTFALTNSGTPGVPATQAPHEAPAPPTATAPVMPAATATLVPAGDRPDQPEYESKETKPKPTPNDNGNGNGNGGKQKNQSTKKPRNNN